MHITRQIHVPGATPEDVVHVLSSRQGAVHFRDIQKYESFERLKNGAVSVSYGTGIPLVPRVQLTVYPNFNTNSVEFDGAFLGGTLRGRWVCRRAPGPDPDPGAVVTIEQSVSGPITALPWFETLVSRRVERAVYDVSKLETGQL